MTVRPQPVGEPPDFRDFFVRNHGFVRRCTRRFGVRDQHADDVVQEIFLIAHKRQSDFDLLAPRPFLRGVAWRVCANFRRRLGLRELQVADVSVESVEGGDGSDERVVKRERARVVRECLAGMDRARAEAFQLMVVEGLSAVDVAQTLEASTHAVYRHVRAAKSALALAIAEHEKGAVAS